MKSPVLCPTTALFSLAAFILSAVSSPAESAKTRTLSSQPCWVIANDQIELALTQTGGHMAPVTFFRDSASPVKPYYVSPWQDEKLPDLPVPVLVPLRGDFFCMPFGGNAEAVNGEKHPPHGEVAGSKWSLVGTRRLGQVTTLTTSLETTVRPGRVTKELSLVDGQNVIYASHRIEGFAGRTPLGHHATLAMPEDEGAFRIATSPIRFGMVCASQFSNPAAGEYQSLQIGARFTDLRKVPLAWKGAPDANLTVLPARKGFADLVQIVNEPWEKTGGPAWVTALNTREHWLWFSLKDPAILTTTVFWIENHGRHGRPWYGRNNCLGLEDVTAHFADGLSASVNDNVLTREGVQTALELSATQPTMIQYIQGVVKVPAGFDEVKAVEFGTGTATFVSRSGQRVTTAVRHEFVRDGKL